ARAGGVAGDDDDVADDDRAGRIAEAAGQRLVLEEVEAGPSVIAEVGIDLPGLGVQRVEILAADDDDPLIAAALPVIDAARARAGRLFFGAGERLLLPDGGAGRRIERADEAVRVLRVEHAVDEDRRGSEIAVDVQIGERLLQLVVDRGPPPGDLQLLDVVPGDLIERGIAGERLVAAEVAPLGARLRADGDDAGDDQRQRATGSRDLLRASPRSELVADAELHRARPDDRQRLRPWRRRRHLRAVVAQRQRRIGVEDVE